MMTMRERGQSIKDTSAGGAANTADQARTNSAFPTSHLLERGWPSALVPGPAIRFSDGGLRFIPDVSFPATRGEVFASAVEHGAPAQVLMHIEELPSLVSSAYDLPDLWTGGSRDALDALSPPPAPQARDHQGAAGASPASSP
ncbi:MAG: hypothetical protein ACYDDF_06560 [Thermoplasmatota archaeon]